MGLRLWLVAGLAAFDLMIVAAVYFSFRFYPPMNRRALFVGGAGMSGFVFQTFLTLDGAFLIMQLATLASLFGLCWLQHLGRLSRHEAVLLKETESESSRPSA